MFAASVKDNYAKLMARWCKELYGKKMMPTQIKEFWRNRFVRLALLHIIFSKDNMCDKLKLWITALPYPVDNGASL